MTEINPFSTTSKPIKNGLEINGDKPLNGILFNMNTLKKKYKTNKATWSNVIFIMFLNSFCLYTKKLIRNIAAGKVIAISFVNSARIKNIKIK